MSSARPRLRRRLVLGLAGITASVLGVALAVAWWVLNVQLLAAVDADLSRHVAWLERMTAGQGRSAWSGPAALHGRELLIEVRDADGRSLRRSPGLRPDSDLQLGAVVGQPADSVRIEGRHLRRKVVGLDRLPSALSSLAGSASNPVTVTLALPLEREDAELARVAATFAAVWLLATTLSALAAYLLGGSLLRPIRQLGERLGGIDPAAPAPLGAWTGPQELAVVETTIDTLLGDLARTMSRERSTLADMAHELRTPLASLRARLEFRRLTKPGPAEDAVLTACHATVLRMQARVAALLVLARWDAGAEAPSLCDFDLAPLLQAACQEIQPAAQARQQTLRPPATAAIRVHSAIEPLRLILDNLLTNAVAHGPEGAEIMVDCVAEAGQVRISMVNPLRPTSGPTASGRLGLVLCRRLASHLNAKLETRAEAEVFIATLQLPCARS